jgi:hypothetical protein
MIGPGSATRGMDDDVPKIARSRGWLVTIITVTVVVVGLAATLFGLGTRNHAVASSNASSWLYSSGKGEVGRVNAETGRVDTRVKVTNAQGHQIIVSQTDQYLVLRDVTTGQISSLNLASLQVAATTPTTPGLGISVTLGKDSAFIVDSVQGVVRQLNPVTLTSVGEPLRFPPGLVGGVFDENNAMWLAIPSEGTLIEIRPGALGASGGAAGSPTIAATRPVADPGHDLALSTLTNGVAVLDQTAQRLTMLRAGKTETISLTLSGPGAMPTHNTEQQVPVTVIDDRHVYVVSNGHVTDFLVPGDGPKLEAAVAFAGRLYIADRATGTVYVLNSTGQLINTIGVPKAENGIDLTVRGGHLFINTPDADTARVVDANNKVKVVDKYANDILGGDQKNPNQPPPTKPADKPKPTAPGAPTNVKATAGNQTAHISWGPAPTNGAAILKYVVEGDGPTPHEVGASQRSFDATNLVNGQTYTFTVYAVNAKGNGPKRAANPVIPTRDVPDPPASVTAKEAADGSVTVTWPAANGQGHPIRQYDVIALSSGVQAPAGTVAGPGTTLKIPAGTLDYGTQYAFTVTAVNDKGASSKPSDLSNSVVPYTKPGAVKSLAAATVDAKGTISVTWGAAAANGRAITGYTVTANGGTAQTVTTTSVTLNGFADGANVSVSVAAVNLAGAGPATTDTARTIDKPAITAGNPGAASYTTINVPFTVNTNGGSTSCTIAVNGGGASAIGCTGGTVSGLWPATKYSYTVTATNKAGADSFSGSQTTPTLNGSVICGDASYCGPNAPNGGIWIYKTPSQNGTSVGDAFNGDRYKAICKATGSATINAKPWGGKQSNMWVKINFSGENYIPFAWFTLDGGDSLSNLPTC